MTNLFATPEWKLVTALAIGLIIGIERERHKRSSSQKLSAGLRTFGLIALLGGLVELTGSAAVTILAGGFVGTATLLAYFRSSQQVSGLTGEVAALVTFVLGYLAMTKPEVAVGSSLLIAVMLACRVAMHRFVRTALTRRDMLDGFAFLVAALVVLPLVPNHSVDVWGLINPFRLWRMAIVLMSLSALGYIALRAIGSRYGLTIAGFFSGFVSSTVAIAAMGGRARDDERLIVPAAAGAVAAILGSLAYLVALVGAVDPRLLIELLPAFAGALVPTLIYGAVLGWRTIHSVAVKIPAGRAFDARLALFFAAMVAIFAVAGKLLTLWLGGAGLLISSVATGFIDAHATAVSVATLSASGGADLPVAELALLIGLSVNMAAKIPASFVLGPRSFAIRVSFGLVLLLAGTWFGFAAGRL